MCTYEGGCGKDYASQSGLLAHVKDKHLGMSVFPKKLKHQQKSYSREHHFTTYSSCHQCSNTLDKQHTGIVHSISPTPLAIDTGHVDATSCGCFSAVFAAISLLKLLISRGTSSRTSKTQDSGPISAMSKTATTHATQRIISKTTCRDTPT